MRRSAATIAGTALLVLAGPLAAHAAQGDILWLDTSERTHLFTHPDNGSCHTFTVHGTNTTALRLVNYTDHKLEVYGRAHCKGPGLWTLDPDDEYPSEDAMSVKVWATDEAP